MERKFDRAPYLNHWCDKYIAVLVINVWVNILDRASEEYTVFQREQTAIELRYKRQTICSSEITKIQKESRLCERGFAIEWICEVSCQTWFLLYSIWFLPVYKFGCEGGREKKTNICACETEIGPERGYSFYRRIYVFSHHPNSIILTRCKELDDFCHLKFYYF